MVQWREFTDPYARVFGDDTYYPYGGDHGYDDYGYDSEDDCSQDYYYSEGESRGIQTLAGTTAQDDDDETSSQGSLRHAKIRAGRYEGYGYSNFCCTRDSIHRQLHHNFNMPEIRSVLLELRLPKSGRKADLIDRLADHMSILYTAGNTSDLNAVVSSLNSRSRTPAVPAFAEYPNFYALNDFFEKSKAYNFNIEVPTGYKIDRYLSDPAYLALASDDVAKRVVLQFNNTVTCPRPRNQYLAFLVLRIYDIEEHPVEGSVHYRFSCGSKISGASANDYVWRLVPKDDSVFQFFRLDNGIARPGLNIISFTCPPKTPYYVQVVELSFDSTAKLTIPSEKVKNMFLDRARLSDVQASSLQLSLRCPLTLVRIKTPVRFESCKHLQCVELRAWESHTGSSNDHYSSSTNRLCPICNSTSSSTVIIDGYFKEILEGTNEDVDVVTVDVENGLKWSLNLASSSRESIALHPEADPRASPPIGFPEEPITVDLTEDTRLYDSPWVQPAPVKPEPALPAAVAQHLSTLRQPRPSSSGEEDFVDLTRESPNRTHLQMGNRPPRPLYQEPDFPEIIEID
jgi:hypothetical protein